MKKLSIKQILQVLYYIQRNAPRDSQSKDIMYLLKIVFFAVRYHIRNYGTPFLNVTFYAMTRGPVASEVKDILEHKMPFKCDDESEDLLNEVEAVSDFEYEIKKQDCDKLSPSFIESLDFALANFGRLSAFDLSDVSHIYPEWKKYEKALLEEKGKRFLMNYVDFFEDPVDLQNISRDPFADDRVFLETLKQDYIENAVSC